MCRSCRYFCVIWYMPSSEIFDFVANIYPAFVNLIDNAVYWLSTSTAYATAADAQSKYPQREISLDYEAGAFVIKDNGPGVLSVDRDAIFESGFSRKPGGSGLGLYITRSLLERAGYSLELERPGQDGGTSFRILVPEDARRTEGPSGEENGGE